MKTKICLFVSIFSLFGYATAQTTTQDWFWQYPRPQGNTLNDIFIFNQDTAVAVGDVGTVIKTTDRGTSWNVQHHAGGTSYDLYSVHFVDDKDGWAAGGVRDMQKNVLLKTDDGGIHWTEIATDTPLCYNAVYFVDTDTGIVVGEDGIVLRTTDSGNTWDTRKIDDYIGIPHFDVFDLWSLTFTDKKTGWIVGVGYYGNQIYKTTDCGRTWTWNEQIVQPKVYSGLYDICFTDTNHGFIAGDMGVFLKTTDGGTTWQYQNLYEKYQKDGYQFFYSTFFADSLTGWIVGGDYYAFILKTTDGGENWIEEANNNSEMVHHFYKIKFSNLPKNNTGWVVGQFGMIYRTTDSGENWLSQRDTNYNFSSIYFVDENNGWAVGDSGVILHTTNGGDDWKVQNKNDSLLLSSVYAIDAQNVFVVGSILDVGYTPVKPKAATILRTSNCGLTWLTQTFDTLYAFNSIAFVNDSIGWVAAGLGLLKTTDKGETWYKISGGSNTPTTNLQFIDNDVGWGSLYAGNYILKTTDGGKNWKQQLVDSNFSTYDFHFINLNKGLTVGSYFGYNNIFRTADGGENWEPCNNVPVSHYNGVQFADENTAWAVGGYGLTGRVESVIIKTTDGGNTWYKQISPSTGELSKVYFLNENIGWVVGSGIIKTINGGGVASVRNPNSSNNNIPTQIELYQNYPNPFNPSTTIKYYLFKTSLVSLKIYDVLGRVVATLVNEKQQKGEHEANWDAKKLSSGIYFYRFTAGEFSETKKMILLR